MAVAYVYGVARADVPPLEDLTEQVRRAKARRAPRNEPRMRSDAREAAGAEKKEGVSGAPSEAGRHEQKTFGGLSKGFLLSGPTQKRRKLPPTTAAKEKRHALSSGTHSEREAASTKRGTRIEDRADGGVEDMPFLRQQDVRDKGPVFPEVQEAMKEAYPLLNTEGM